ncbi:MAG TPA: helix-turn-helix domain-containing protein [Ktedonobacteraceae bacterium]|nr:helix-turn-helix domain-containing protein [Ktedonobacteraceae bacterium]
MTPSPDPSSGEALLSIPQVAQRLGICRAQVYRLINASAGDRLPAVHIGRSVRISCRTLEEWIRAHEQ